MDQEQYKICLLNKLLFKAHNPNYIINGLVTPGTKKIRRQNWRWKERSLVVFVEEKKTEA